MKKNKKKILTAGITFGILISTITGLCAKSVSLDYAVPRAQEVVYLQTAAKSSRTAYGMANITEQTSDKISFSVRALGDDFGPVISSTGTGGLRIPYLKEYAKDTNMQGRFRNGNWSLVTGAIKGSFDYK